MEKVDLTDLEWQLNKKENVFIGLNEKLVSKELGIYHARIDPKEQLKKHFHNRPNGGKEVFFFYEGGHFEVELENRKREFNTVQPIYIIFSDKEIHAVRNLEDKPLEFQAIYCPDFEIGEVVHVD